MSSAPRATSLPIIDEAHRAKGDGSAFNEALRNLGDRANWKLILSEILQHQARRVRQATAPVRRRRANSRRRVAMRKWVAARPPRAPWMVRTKCGIQGGS